MTPAQLARKRANDREAHRAIRARTRERLERLEQEVEELKTQQGRDQIKSRLPSLGLLLQANCVHVDLEPDWFPLSRISKDQHGKLCYKLPEETSVEFNLLGWLATAGFTDALTYYLDCGAYVDEQPLESEYTPLFLSLYFHKVETAEMLLQRKADPNVTSGLNALHAASRHGLNEIISTLIRQHNVDPDIEDMDGAVPIVYALFLPWEKALSTISHLCNLGARTDILIGYKWSLPDIARAMGKDRIFEFVSQTRFEHQHI